MKKLMLTVIVVVSISLASFANNANATQFNRNGDNIESVENDGPHTKQYEDLKKILDEYQEDLKNATSCEELDNADIAMFIKIMATAENNYPEEATPEENQEIMEYMNRLEIESKTLQEKFGCKPEGDGDEE